MATQTLPYGTERRRSVGRRIAAVVLVAALAGLVVWRGDAVWSQLAYVWHQRACLAYRAPPDHPVFEENPVMQRRLLSQPGYRRVEPSFVSGIDPPEWWDGAVGFVPPPLTAMAPATPFYDIAFLHERRNPSGARRLVVVSYNVAVWPDYRHFNLGHHVLVPATLRPGSRLRFGPTPQPSFNVPAGYIFRLFAGQPDPDDPTRFTIPFEFRGQRGVIDGRVIDDHRVELRFRAGPATELLKACQTEAGILFAPNGANYQGTASKT